MALPVTRVETAVLFYFGTKDHSWHYSVNAALKPTRDLLGIHTRDYYDLVLVVFRVMTKFIVFLSAGV
jgi:hypothetical protein